MLFVVLAIGAVLGGLGIGISAAIDEPWARYENIFLGCFIALCGGVLVLFLGGLVSFFVPHTFTYEERPLSALQDGSTTEGSFFLGTGVIDEEQVYTYYMQEGKGFKLDNSPADQVTVFQDTEKPYALKQKDCKSKAEWLVFCVTDNRVTEIHVPKGTIKNNFVLDAK